MPTDRQTVQFELEPEEAQGSVMMENAKEKMNQIKSGLGQAGNRVKDTLVSGWTKTTNYVTGLVSRNKRSGYQQLEAAQKKESSIKQDLVKFIKLLDRPNRYLIVFGIAMALIEALAHYAIPYLLGLATGSLVDTAKKGFRPESEAGRLLCNCGQADLSFEDIIKKAPTFARSELESYNKLITIIIILITIAIIAASYLQIVSWKVVAHRVKRKLANSGQESGDNKNNTLSNLAGLPVEPGTPPTSGDQNDKPGFFSSIGNKLKGSKIWKSLFGSTSNENDEPNGNGQSMSGYIDMDQDQASSGGQQTSIDLDNSSTIDMVAQRESRGNLATPDTEMPADRKRTSGEKGGFSMLRNLTSKTKSKSLFKTDLISTDEKSLNLDEINQSGPMKLALPAALNPSQMDQQSRSSYSGLNQTRDLLEGQQTSTPLSGSSTIEINREEGNAETSVGQKATVKERKGFSLLRNLTTKSMSKSKSSKTDSLSTGGNLVSVVDTDQLDNLRPESSSEKNQFSSINRQSVEIEINDESSTIEGNLKTDSNTWEEVTTTSFSGGKTFTKITRIDSSGMKENLSSMAEEEGKSWGSISGQIFGSGSSEMNKSPPEKKKSSSGSGKDQASAEGQSRSFLDNLEEGTGGHLDIQYRDLTKSGLFKANMPVDSDSDVSVVPRSSDTDDDARPEDRPTKSKPTKPLSMIDNLTNSILPANDPDNPNDPNQMEEGGSGGSKSKVNKDSLADATMQDMGEAVRQSSQVLTGVGFTFAQSLPLTGAIALASPILVGCVYFSLKMKKEVEVEEEEDNSSSEDRSKEMLTQFLDSRETITALGGQSNQIEQFAEQSWLGSRRATKRALKRAAIRATSVILFLAILAIIVQVASRLVAGESLSSGAIVAIVTSVLSIVWSLGRLIPIGKRLPEEIKKLVDDDLGALPQSVQDKLTSGQISSSDQPIASGSIGLDQDVSLMQFSNVSITAPSRLIRDLSFKLKANDHVTLIEPDPEADSVICSLLMGTLRPESGSIMINDIVVAGNETNLARAGLCLIDSNVGDPEMTVTEYIVADRKGESAKKLMSRARKAAQKANLDELIESLPDEYDFKLGQLQDDQYILDRYRLNLARGIANKAMIYVIREPMDLPETGRDEQMSTLVQDVRKVAKCTLFIRHRPFTPIAMDELTIICDKSGAIETGTAGELMEQRGIYWQFMRPSMDLQTKDESRSDSGQSDRDQSYQLAETQADQSLVDFRERRKTRGTGNMIYIERKITTTTENITTRDIETTEISHTIARKYTTSIQEWTGSIERNPSVSSLERFVKFFRPEWLYLLLALVFSSALGLLVPLLGILLSQFIDLTVIPEDDQIIPFGNNWSLQLFCFGLIVGTLMVAQTVASSYAIESAAARLRLICFSNLVLQDARYFERPENSRESLYYRLGGSIDQLKSYMWFSVTTVTVATSIVISALFFALAYNWLLSVMIILLFLVFYFMIRYLCSRFDRKIATQVSDPVSGLWTPAPGSEPSSGYFSRAVKMIKSEPVDLVQVSTPVVPNLLKATIFGAGAYLVSINTLTTVNMYRIILILIVSGFLLAAIIYIWRTRTSLNVSKIAQSIGLVGRQLALVHMDDVFTRGGIKVPLKGQISFQDVFMDPDQFGTTNGCLYGIDLDIEIGQKVSLVGLPGSGIERLGKLLIRYFEPDSGNITIDRFHLQAINLNHLRQSIGLISSQPKVFQRISIKANLIYGLDSRKRISMRRIVEATKFAKIHNWIVSLPKKYESIVGEDFNLQDMTVLLRQQLHIARIYVRKSAIIILDDPSRHLDQSDDKLILDEILDELTKDKTCIRISNDIRYTSKADNIVVMDRGSIVQQGKHDQLMQSQDSPYREIVEQVPSAYEDSG